MTDISRKALKYIRLRPDERGLVEIALALRNRVDELEKDKRNFYYDMAKWANRKWDSDVKNRPEVNVYRAGLDKAWRYLEQWCIEQQAERGDD